MRDRFGLEERRRAAAALRPTSAMAADRLQRFVEEGGAMVTTGQQAGLFTGPLYTIYKILTAIRLAEALEAALGVVVLPVFWVASEDHDWEEVNHATIIDDRGRLQRLTLSSSDPRPLPMNERRLDDSVRNVLDKIAYVFGVTPDTDSCLTLLREAYRPGQTVAAAFREVVERLFEPFHLLVTDAADPALKDASAPVLLGEAMHSEAHASELRQRTIQLTDAGYHVQAPVLDGAVNLFYHGSEGRRRLYRKDERWYADESSKSFTREEIEHLVRDDPTRFSPNVFLRPVVESYVFPTLAYVAGPGEISYFAQIGELFAAFGMEPPVVYPRFSALLMDGRTERILDLLGISAGELSSAPHVLESLVARNAMPDSVNDALAGLRRSLVDGYRDLIAAANAIDPTLEGPLGANRNRTLTDIARSEQKILRQLKRRQHEHLEAIRLARASVFPDGKPQERVLNVFSYLGRQGPDLLARLGNAIDVAGVGVPCRESS